MRKVLTSTFFLFAFFSFFICGISYATRELSLDTAQLAREAVDIVVARCVSQEIKKDDKTGFIFTYTTFEIEDSLKSKYGGNVVLRMLGGQIGDLRTIVPDKPQFREGEDVILFLGKRNTAGYPVLKSISRAVYRIGVGENGRKIITTPEIGLNIYRSGTNQKVSNNDRVFLDDFLYSLSKVLD